LFSELPLHERLLKALAELSFQQPTEVQQQAIPAAIAGRDLYVIAQTGSGKTAAYVLPMLQRLLQDDSKPLAPRGLILVPTRELARQVLKDIAALAQFTFLKAEQVTGGEDFKVQAARLRKNPDIVVATPGRALEQLTAGNLELTAVQTLVLDEADRMLDMGFIPDIERIFSLTPFTRQTLFFSATMAPEIERITNAFLSNPTKIEVARQATAAENISQGVVLFKGSRRDRTASEKRDLLRAIITGEGDKLTNAMIFCNRKTDVDIVAKSLKKHGFDAAPIHGDLDQSQRTQTLDSFRNNKLRILVASDVAARGLDVPSVSHVLNYDVPGHAEDYVHRIGRTGRAGRDGRAIMICESRDEKNLAAVEHLLGKEIPRLANPIGQNQPESAQAVQAKPEERPKRARSNRKPDTRKATEEKTTQEAVTPAAETQNPGPAQKPGKNRGERGSRGGKGVVGMGDHLPSFIAKSLDDRRAG